MKWEYFYISLSCRLSVITVPSQRVQSVLSGGFVYFSSMNSFTITKNYHKQQTIYMTFFTVLPNFMTLRETSLYLRVSEDVVRKMVEVGDIPSLRLGSEIRISKKALDNLF